MKIKKGNLLLYCCYDIADEIFLDQIKTKLKAQTSDLKPKQYILYEDAPLILELGKFFSKEINKEISVKAKIYSFGVLTIRFMIPIEGNLLELNKIGNQLVNQNILEKEAKKYREKICEKINMFCKSYRVEENFENYLIYYISKLDIHMNAEMLFKRQKNTISHLLRFEKQTLSPQEIKECVKDKFSYYSDDLVIIDIDAAFIYDPRYSYEILDVIEFAVIQSLELRVYDKILDASLIKAHQDIESYKKKYFSFMLPYSSVVKSLMQFKIDISQIVEKVKSSLKFVGDRYLAKIYNAAANRFYLQRWTNSVNDKLSILNSTYDSIYHQIQDVRMLWLEIAIVAMFILDLIIIYAAEFG